MGSSQYVALLRAVNVGGAVVDPAALRSTAESLGYARVRSWLRTGNLVFEAPSSPSPRLEADLERAAASRLGLPTVVVVRTATEWERTVEENPFTDFARTDPSHLLVVALKGVTPSERVEEFGSTIQGRERVAAGPGCVYATYPDGIGRSRLTLPRLERDLGVLGTGRNWNTVLRLHRMLGSP